MLQLLAFGTLWFWLILALTVILMITASEKNSGIGATITLIISLLLFYFFGNGKELGGFFSYCTAHPWISIGIIALYFILGVCWAICKWYFYLINERDRQIEENSDEGHPYYHKPEASGHKSEIIVWMSYWPFSAIWTIINDPVKKAFKYIYNRIAKYFQRMSDKIFDPLVAKTEAARESRRSR